MISFLQKYLAINTSQPNPDYQSVCALFRAQAELDGFFYNEIRLPSDKPVIIITYEGTNPALAALILNHHMDVVPATNTEKWTQAPFAGTIIDGVIIGRGVQDMKGVGVAHYYALKELANAGIRLTRTVHVVVVPDEEIGGFTGTKLFIETDFFKTMNVGFVIDEGIPSGDPHSLALKVTERKPLQIQITVTGSLAHGSQLNCFNAIHELVAMLHKITMHHHEQQQKSTLQPDGLLLSMNITSLNAGTYNNNKVCLNMIPDYASATLDIRVPPTMLMHEAVTIIETVINQHAHSSYTVLATVPDQPIRDCYMTPLYHSLAHTIEQYGLTAQPLYFEGSSDLRFYHALQIDGLGFTPFVTTNAIHCTNESLPIADLIQGKNIMVNFLKNFCIIKENTND